MNCFGIGVFLFILGGFAITFVGSVRVHDDRLETFRKSAPGPHYFQQQLDHFDPEDTREFTQKYYFDADYWDPLHGPVFLYINGEAPCTGLPNDYITGLSQKFQALLVTVEHRYYGESTPFPTLTTDNLKYMSTKQALSDLAYFVTYFNGLLRNENNLPNDPKWITIGCSYAGALSAWFRLKFPHLTIGSISSSGVVHIIDDFTQFDEQVAASAGPECADQLRTITKLIEDELYADKVHNEKVKSLFQADGFDNGDFLFLVADIAAESIQYGFHSKLCGAIVGQDKEELLDIYVNYTVNYYYKIFGGPEDYSLEAVLNETSPNADRVWWWQQCSELGWFQNAPKVGSIRSQAVNMNYHLKKCKAAFGKDLWPSRRFTNTYYGGKEIQATSVAFFDSSQDPWQQASVSFAPNSEEEYFFIQCPSCGHCSEVRGCPSLFNYHNINGCVDPENNVEKAREILVTRIENWLK